MPPKITQAVLLSAGLGTRLRSVARDLPKVMVPIKGKPLLQWHLEQFQRHGVEEFFINLHYMPEVIRDYFGDGKNFGVRISYFLEPDILGTAGGVKSFEKQLGQYFFVIYADVFSLVDYSAMASAFFKKPDCLGMEIIGDTDHPLDSDLVEVDEDSRFVTIHPKPHQRLPERYKSMRGAYIFRKTILEFAPLDQYYEIDHQLLIEALRLGARFYGYETADFMKDIGTPERYEQVEQMTKP